MIRITKFETCLIMHHNAKIVMQPIWNEAKARAQDKIQVKKHTMVKTALDKWHSKHQRRYPRECVFVSEGTQHHSCICSHLSFFFFWVSLVQGNETHETGWNLHVNNSQWIRTEAVECTNGAFSPPSLSQGNETHETGCNSHA